MFSVEERVQIIKWYYSGCTVEEIIGRFIFMFENRPVPASTTIKDMVHRFENTGCTQNCTKCRDHDFPQPPEGIRHPRNENQEQRETAVCSLAEVNFPCNSTAIAAELDIAPRTVRNILKRNKYRCYKLRTTQEIFPEDCEKRMLFCKDMIERSNQDNTFIANILFTDESSFSLHGRHNPSVTVAYSRENRHISVPIRTQYPQKVNVWADILNNHIIGPFFIDGNLNANKYLNLLRENVLPAVHNLNINLQEIWFQQDGCPAHNARDVQAFLHQTFPNRLICRNGTVNWPPRSPDLAPNDFFLWGHVTQKLYGHRHMRAEDLGQLRQKIVEILGSISNQTFINVRQKFYDRLGYCLAKAGDLFENEIK